jgi:hypothetical protein
VTGSEKDAKTLRIVAWILAATYLVGAPVAGFLEYSGQMLSQRFDLPPPLIYATCTAQAILAVGLLSSRYAIWSAGLLTVLAVGAVGSHLRIGSALTALPALAYVAVQLWFITAVRRARMPAL